ncbi:type II secretion system protein [Candidatus Daviesbacteria bacterium]|nr:type II secretion system protein [Candidatus Daviesbacteria bacterium]
MPAQKKGFTLIELLITISIIAILSAIGLILYSSVLKQGRDSKRQADLKSIQLALEQYVTEADAYPGQIGYLCNISQGSPCAGSRRNYMTQIPQGYGYVPLGCDAAGNNCTSYCLYAKLENPPSPPQSLPVSCGTSWPLAPDFSDYNFVVTPP